MTGDDDLLFHYTGPAGVLGVVTDSCLWASDVEFLNDAQELVFGRDELHASMLALAESIDDPAAPHGQAASRATIVRSAASHLSPDGIFATRSHLSVFAACFCEGEDVLSQWRGYAGAHGYALGFDRIALAATDFSAYSSSPQLVKVRYGHEAVPPMIQTVLGNVAPHASGHPGSKGYFQAAQVVLPALAQVKHPAFAEEREWRLITTSDAVAEFSFRGSGGWIVPYLKGNLPANALREIVVGPGPNQPLRQAALSKLLHAQGCDDVGVLLSTVPYRG